MLGVNTNVSSLIAQNSLDKNSVMLAQSLQRLSTGLKINSGADGPAAFVISQEQQSQISGLQTAIQNTSEATSMVQTAAGGLGTINDLLNQMRSLALDSANSGVNDPNAQAANQAEVANALATIDRIATNTQFGTKQILNGSAGLSGVSTNPNVTFIAALANVAAAGSYAVQIATAAAKATATTAIANTGVMAQNETITINGVNIGLTAGQNQSQVRDTINTYSGQTGVTASITGGLLLQLQSNLFGSAQTVTATSNVAASGTSSGIGTGAGITGTGVDVAGTIGGFNATGQGNILTGNTGTGAQGITISVAGGVTGALGNVNVTDNSLVFQIGANANQTVKVGIDNVGTAALGLGVAGNQFANLGQIDIQTTSGAQDAIKIIDSATLQVSKLSGTLGAVQSQTLAETASNLQTTLTNTTNAESVIRDTNFASETANYSKYQVLMQVGTAVLQNSNQMGQLVIKLFQ
jgi:flagellin